MRYTFRKQTREDFTARLQRMDGTGRHHGAAVDPVPRRPVVWTLAGFGWCYLVIAVATRKDQIRDSLAQGALPAHLHDIVMGGLAALLAISGVMLALHVLRALTRRGARRANSTSLVFGAFTAGLLVLTPPDVFQAGFGLLDANSQTFLRAAHATVRDSVPGVDWGSIVMVASNGR